MISLLARLVLLIVWPGFYRRTEYDQEGLPNWFVLGCVKCLIYFAFVWAILRATGQHW